VILFDLAADYQYLAINAAIGIGISADAMIATVGRFRRFERASDAIAWAAAIGLTHTIFPTIGLIGLWYAASLFPSLKAGIYGAGFAIMVWFIVMLLREVAGLDADEDCEDEDCEEERDVLYRILFKHSKFFAAVWGVSIDALVTGPGKTAATAQWSQAQVLGSFLLVGFIVFGLVMLSAWPALLLRRRWLDKKAGNPRQLARFTAIGSWLELGIFLYFAYLAISEAILALGVEKVVSEFLLAGIFAIATTAILLALLGDRVWDNQLDEAEELFQQ